MGPSALTRAVAKVCARRPAATPAAARPPAATAAAVHPAAASPVVATHWCYSSSCCVPSCGVSSCCCPVCCQTAWCLPTLRIFLLLNFIPHTSPESTTSINAYSFFFFISFVHSIWTGSDLSLCLSIPSIVPPRNCSKISSLNWVPQRLSRFCACYLDIPADDQMSTLVPGDRLLIPWLLCVTWPLQWVLCDGTTTCP